MPSGYGPKREGRRRETTAERGEPETETEAEDVRYPGCEVVLEPAPERGGRARLLRRPDHNAHSVSCTEARRGHAARHRARLGRRPPRGRKWLTAPSTARVPAHAPDRQGRPQPERGLAGRGGELAGIAAGELGIPPEDVKVVHEDTDRFGEGNSFNRDPSDAVGENVAAHRAQAARQGPDRRRLDARAPHPTPSASTTATGACRGAIPGGSGSRRSRSTPSAASSFRRGSRARSTPRRPTGSGPCRRPGRPSPGTSLPMIG